MLANVWIFLDSKIFFNVKKKWNFYINCDHNKNWSKKKG